jgi:hypothetical protein
MATLVPVRLSTAELRGGRLSGPAGPSPRHRLPRGPSRPARSPHCAVGTRAHGLQVLIHGAHFPGCLGHLLAVKALSGRRRRAHRRPGRLAPGRGPRIWGFPRRAPRATARQGRLCAARPPLELSLLLFLRSLHPGLFPTVDPSPAGSTRPLPRPRTNRPPGPVHVTPRPPSGPSGNPRRRTGEG